MDEDSLQAALQAHGAQLRQVERALRAGLDASELADLRRLQRDLRELIALTEASLASVRQSKLLAALDGERAAQDEAERPAFPEAAAEAAEGPEAEPEREAGPEAGAPGPEAGGEAGAALSGRTVSAPYRSPWGALEYHGAMVVGAEAAAGGAAGVRVLYLYPTHRALKPCPFFLEGRCRFQESCR